MHRLVGSRIGTQWRLCVAAVLVVGLLSAITGTVEGRAAPTEIATLSRSIVHGLTDGALEWELTSLAEDHLIPSKITVDADGEHAAYFATPDQKWMFAFEESASRRGNVRKGVRRGVCIVSDHQSDETVATFEYAIDRDSDATAEGDDASRTSRVFATSVKDKVSIGTVEIRDVAGTQGGRTISFQLRLDGDGVEQSLHREHFVLRGTNREMILAMEGKAAAASTLWGRWGHPLMLFAALYGLLYAVEAFQRRGKVQ